jgi:shikimate kinase
MLYIIKTASISLLIIVLLHYFWNYLKDTYTTKKTKDLVKTQTEKYKAILDEILETRVPIQKNVDDLFLQNETMQNELDTFLQECNG